MLGGPNYRYAVKEKHIKIVFLNLILEVGIDNGLG